MVLNALVEGNSIRSTEGVFSVHRDTIMRLGIRVSQGCKHLMDRTMAGLPCRQIEVEEIWSFVGKKQHRMKPARIVPSGEDLRSARSHVQAGICVSRWQAHVEQLNLTNRMGMWCLTRLTNDFSKKLENHAAATALHFARYFVRRHVILRVTPCMEAGDTNRL